jgi:transcriptional regulator with XRE-family HTH domain
MATSKVKWGKRLRKAREEIGYSLAEAVKFLYEEHKIKLDRTQLARIERGESDCAVEKFRALCDIYSISSDLILELNHYT